jgi:hypothetical protein
MTLFDQDAGSSTAGADSRRPSSAPAGKGDHAEQLGTLRILLETARACAAVLPGTTTIVDTLTDLLEEVEFLAALVDAERSDTQKEST